MTNQLLREPLSRPGESTEAAPGSPAKIRVLTERASRREALFHPQDNLKRRLPNAPPEPADLDEVEIIEVDEESFLEEEVLEMDVVG